MRIPERARLDDRCTTQIREGYIGALCSSTGPTEFYAATEHGQTTG